MITTPDRCERRAPGIRLGRLGLTVLLISILSLPILAVLALSRSLPPAHDQPLAMRIRLATSESGDAAIRLTNESADELQNLRVEINQAFHFLPPDALSPEGELVLPLHWFAKKSGHRFHPEKWQLETVRVSARLPNNHSAAASQQFQNLGQLAPRGK